jgi:predicted Zn-dependent protease
MATPASVPTHLNIRTLGSLHLRHGETDFTGALLEHPVLSFIWLYLLVRAARSPGDRITRVALADEISPGLDPERQRERLRGRLRDLQRLPGPLSERLQVDEQFVSLDLSSCRFDAARVVALARECRDKHGLLSPELVDEVQVALAESSGEFLPAWEEIEHRITAQRGAAGELVAEVRHEVAAAGVDLLAALGAHYLARREPQRAVTQLEEALRRRPDREDVAMRLAVAYQESGQPRRADQLSREYRLTAGQDAL